MTRIPHPLRLRLAGLVAACVPVVACSQAPAARPVPTLDDIRAAIGDAACSDSSQCRTLAVGAKACGGPEAWLPWSTAKTDGARLAAMAEAHAQARRAENAAAGRMSTCEVLADPGAQCVQGRCTAASGRGAAGPTAR